MIEKKSVVDRLNLSYSGVFDIAEFYKAVEDWKAIHHKEKEIKKKLEEAQKEAKDNYNKWLYLYADFENYKKRVHKEKLDLLTYGNEGLDS